MVEQALEEPLTGDAASEVDPSSAENSNPFAGLDAIDTAATQSTESGPETDAAAEQTTASAEPDSSAEITNATEQLGRFILASNATINMAGSGGTLSFADSSAEIWSASAMLIVSNWNGLPRGAGSEQLKFGTNQLGLTTEN